MLHRWQITCHVQVFSNQWTIFILVETKVIPYPYFLIRCAPWKAVKTPSPKTKPTTIDCSFSLSIIEISNPNQRIFDYVNHQHKTRKNLKRFQRYWEDTICIQKFIKEHNFVKTARGVTVIVLFIFSYDNLYLYQVFLNHLKGLWS